VNPKENERVLLAQCFEITEILERLSGLQSLKRRPCGGVMTLDPEDVEDLGDSLARYQGLDHLRVKRRGDSPTIFSGQSPDTQLHARLTHLGAGQWGLSLPRHTGRWERTPFVGPMDDVVETLVTNFGFYFEDLSPHQEENT